MDGTVNFLHDSNSILNETNHMFKTPEDSKYFYIAIASLVVFLLISILTTVLLCVTLKNEPILWQAGNDVENPPEYTDHIVSEFPGTSDGDALDDDDDDDI